MHLFLHTTDKIPLKMYLHDFDVDGKLFKSRDEILNYIELFKLGYVSQIMSLFQNVHRGLRQIMSNQYNPGGISYAIATISNI
jgi:hypothetical protein